MSPTTMGVESILNRLEAIEDRKDELITKVEGFFNAREEKRQKVVPVAPTQLQNLLRLALSTSSIREMQLFIRYQQGRHKEWRDQDFGQTLERAIEEVERNAPNEIKIDLVRLFLGYFVREARYRRRGD